MSDAYAMILIVSVLAILAFGIFSFGYVYHYEIVHFWMGQ